MSSKMAAKMFDSPPDPQNINGFSTEFYPIVNDRKKI